MKRNQVEARRIARGKYPFPGCCLCGRTVGIQLAHLDHDGTNNDPENLAWLCRHHHWMFDFGLFSIEAVKLQRAYWQSANGKQTTPYMKDAGPKAALTRAKKRIGSEMARSAAATRRRLSQGSAPAENASQAGPAAKGHDDDETPTDSHRAGYTGVEEVEEVQAVEGLIPRCSSTNRRISRLIDGSGHSGCAELDPRSVTWKVYRLKREQTPDRDHFSL